MTGYNYGVIHGGIYRTRHDAVGVAAVLNRGKLTNPHRVIVLPDVIGAVEALPDGFGGDGQ